MKQKTLEEVAEKLTKDFPHYSVRDNMDDSEIKGWFLEALQKGAKWQQERSYSEEEVRELLIQRCKHFGTSLSPFDKLLLKQDLEFFEQFKKR